MFHHSRIVASRATFGAHAHCMSFPVVPLRCTTGYHLSLLRGDLVHSPRVHRRPSALRTEPFLRPPPPPRRSCGHSSSSTFYLLLSTFLVPMTLSELAEFVCAKAGQTDSDSLSQCKRFLNARLRM